MIENWLCVSLIRRVANSAYHWYRESTSDFFSYEFGREEVVNSPYRRVCETATLRITDTGSRRWWFVVHTVRFNCLPMHLKGQFVKTINQASIFQWSRIYLKVWKNVYVRFSGRSPVSLTARSRFSNTNNSVSSNSNFEKFYEQCKGPLPNRNIQKNLKIGLVGIFLSTVQ